jgi:hypothetical protein
MTNPFTTAANKARENGSRELATRIEIEGRIFGRACSALIASGWLLDLNDGEETVITGSDSITALRAAAFSTDEDYLIAHKGDERGWVRFIYGNDGHDVISDYTTNLEDVLKPVNDYADTLAA